MTAHSPSVIAVRREANESGQRPPAVRRANRGRSPRTARTRYAAERNGVVGREEQMVLGAEEVVREKREQDRAGDRDRGGDRQCAQHEVRAQPDEREREQEEQVHDDRGVLREQAEQLHEQHVQGVAAEARVIEELLPVGSPEVRVVPVPAVENAFDVGVVEEPVGRVRVGHVQIAVPRA